MSTSLPELERAGDLVFTADTAAAFGAAIRKAAPLAQDAAFGQRLRQYALDNAWTFRASDMLAEMAREPKLSVDRPALRRRHRDDVGGAARDAG